MKKVMCMLVAVCLLMSFAMAITAVNAAGTTVYGDVNGDGKVNNRDLGILQQYLNDYDVTVDMEASDVTHDDKVNNRDLGLLQQYLNDWEVDLEPDVPDDDNIYNDTELDWN